MEEELCTLSTAPTHLASRKMKLPHPFGARRASAFRALFLELGFLHCVQPAQAVFRLACTMRWRRTYTGAVSNAIVKLHMLLVERGVYSSKATRSMRIQRHDAAVGCQAYKYNQARQ